MSDELTPVPECDDEVIVGLPAAPVTSPCGVNSDIDPLQRIIAIEQKNKILSSQINSFQRQIGDLNTAIGNIWATDDALDARITENADDIAANTVSIATNAADIATNAADIATNAADILAVQSGTIFAEATVTVPAASPGIVATTFDNILLNATIADTGNTDADFTIDGVGRRIIYTGLTTRDFQVSMSVSFISDKSNEVASFAIAKNGSEELDTEVDRKLGTGSDVGAVSVQGLFSLATNDTIELYGTLGASAGNTITVEKCNIILTGYTPA